MDVRWDGMGWDGMGWDGMGWDGEGGGLSAADSRQLSSLSKTFPAPLSANPCCF